MMLGIRGKLVLVSLALIVLAGGAAIATLEFRLRAVLEDSVALELERHAKSFRAALAVTAVDVTAPQDRTPTISRADIIARATALSTIFARETETRVTVVDRDGVVVVDTDAVAAQLDNHGDRPEIIAARKGRVGTSHRKSSTLGKDMLYVALPIFEIGPGVVVRVSRPLSAVLSLIRSFRLALVAAAALAFLVAVFMSSLASQLVTKTLRNLVIGARALAEGKRRDALEVGGADEIGTLTNSVNRMAADTRRSLKTLAAERDRMQAVLEGMGEAVLSLDDKLRVRLANPAAHALLGMKEIDEKEPLPGALQVPSLAKLLQRGLSRRSVDDDESEANRVEELSVEFELPRDDDEVRIVHARVTPLRTYRGLILVMLDVTEQRRLETLRRDFVANVSHELRTPVAVMQASAEALLDGALDDKERGPRFVDAIHRNAERLSRLISDVLDLARIEAGAAPGARSPALSRVCLSDAVEAALASVQEQSHTRHQRLLNSVDDTVWIVADPESLEQILVNLLVNAIKYTPEGGEIDVRAAPTPPTKSDAPRIRISVVDDGPGISSEHRERLFERFYRVDEGRAKNTGGTGLGLSIVKHLALAMGGEAGFLPGVPHGSQFWFELDASDAE